MAYVSSYLFSIDALMIDTGAHVMTTVECLWRPPSTVHNHDNDDDDNGMFTYWYDTETIW